MRAVCLAVCLFDCFIHSVLIFGWVAMTEIYKREGYYCDQDSDNCLQQNSNLATILAIGGGFVGLFVFCCGLIRDYIGFGPCRLLILAVLSICYGQFYIAEPNVSDNLLYLWVVQYGTGIGLLISYQQVSRMFPNSRGLVLGVFNLAGQSSTLWPSAWNFFIENNWLSLGQIYLAWIGLAILSAILGTLVLPWHSIKDDITWTAETKYDTLLDILKKKTPCWDHDDISFTKKFLNNLNYLKSPMTFASLYHFALGNFIVHISLELMNTVLEYKLGVINDGRYKYEDYYKLFNILRGVIGLLACPIYGFISDKSLGCFRTDAPNKDIKGLLVPSLLNQLLMVIFGVSIFFTNIFAVWISMLSVILISSWVYVYESISAELVFPAEATAIIFAIVETFGGFLNFAAAPLIKNVEHYGLDSFYYTSIGVALALCFVNFVQWPVAFMKGPTFLLRSDRCRLNAVKSVHDGKNDEKELNVLLE